MTPVAVIGMACRLPGGIDSPELLWKALLRGDDLITEVPPDRWDCDEFYDPQPGVPGRTVCKWGGFLDNPADFDCEFFGIGEREAIAIDPQQRLLLETSWEAMEHAGLTQQTLAGSATGVFAGVTHGDYTMVAADAKQLEEPYGYLGNSFSMASGRVAYAMRLHGPAITVDTACSSGLTAVHMACRSLHEGESDVALAGGVALMLEPRKAAAGSALGMLSPTGRCRAFDVAADGFVSGEGCAVVVLKRLPDALADGDRILAVIRGTSANQDGHTVNIATPSQPAQVAAYRAALAAGGVDAATVGMVEAHGPGTPIGDPIEYASVSEVYGVDGPCALASVKTNFGHTQSTAGVLGLIKVVLALKHGVVPRNLHFTRLPDEIAGITTKPLRARGDHTVAHQRSSGAPAGGSVVLWVLGNERARCCGASSANRSPAPRGEHPPDRHPCLVHAVRFLGRRAAADCSAVDRLDTAARRLPGALGSCVHAGAAAYAPVGAHGGHREQRRRADCRLGRGRRR